MTVISPTYEEVATLGGEIKGKTVTFDSHLGMLTGEVKSFSIIGSVREWQLILRVDVDGIVYLRLRHQVKLVK
jgi:hypothetical protein